MCLIFKLITIVFICCGSVDKLIANFTNFVRFYFQLASDLTHVLIQGDFLCVNVSNDNTIMYKIKVECPTLWSTQRQIRPFFHMY